jgi:hypothetical protein
MSVLELEPGDAVGRSPAVIRAGFFNARRGLLAATQCLAI